VVRQSRPLCKKEHIFYDLFVHKTVSAGDDHFKSRQLNGDSHLGFTHSKTGQIVQVLNGITSVVGYSK
jgi:hypothetical protein